jgi:hypothetical protein
MPGSISRRVTIGAGPFVPGSITNLPEWAKGKAPVCIVAQGVGSLYVVGEGEESPFAATTANQIQFAAAGQSRDIAVRSINGTGDTPASTAMDIELWWVR